MFNARRIAIIVVLLLIPVAWWLISPLFLDTTVDEEFPFAVPSQEERASMSVAEKQEVLDAAMTAMPDATAMAEMPEDARAEMEEALMEIAAEMPAQEVADEMPEAAEEWTLVSTGTFVGADDFHQGSGTATIFQQGDARVLRFENFQVTNGPALHVLLVENTSADMGAYIDLGSLKGTMGNQNYEIPADGDLTQYSGVMIYCMPFHVVFATAAF